MNRLKQQKNKWRAVILLVIFSLSFASATIPLYSAAKLTKQSGFIKTEKSSKQTSQIPFEGKEKEKEGSSENLQEAAIDCLTTWSVYAYSVFVIRTSYLAPRSCGDVTNLPLYLAKRVLLL